MALVPYSSAVAASEGAAAGGGFNPWLMEGVRELGRQFRAGGYSNQPSASQQRRINREWNEYERRQRLKRVNRSASKRDKRWKKTIGKNMVSGKRSTGTVHSARHNVKSKIKKLSKKRKKKVGTVSKIKKRLSVLEKDKGSDSWYTFQNVQPLNISTANMVEGVTPINFNEQRRAIVCIETFHHEDERIEQRLNAMHTDDLNNANFSSTLNPKQRIHRYQHLTIKNGGKSKVTLKYLKFKCTNSTSEHPLAQFVKINGDRNFGQWTYNGDIPKVSTAGARRSRMPSFVYSGTGDFTQESLHLFDKCENYKQMGVISKAVLNPGDELSISQSDNYVYKCEENDRQAFSFNAGLYFGFILQVCGEIAHDDTRVNHTGFSDFHLDCIQRDTMTVKYANGMGIKRIDNDQADFNTAETGWTFSKPNVVVVNEDS